MGLEAPWNEDGFGEPSPAESPLLRAKSRPGEAIEASDEGSSGAYASLSSMAGPKKKKKMVLTVDAEELEKAHAAIHMGGAQQMEIEELPGGDLPPRLPYPMLGLSAMGEEDEEEDASAYREAPDADWGEPEEAGEEDLPPLPDFSQIEDQAEETEPGAKGPAARSLDHLLRPSVEEAQEDDEAFIPSIEDQLRNMRKRPRALPVEEPVDAVADEPVAHTPEPAADNPTDQPVEDESLAAERPEPVVDESAPEPFIEAQDASVDEPPVAPQPEDKVEEAQAAVPPEPVEAGEEVSPDAEIADAELANGAEDPVATQDQIAADEDVTVPWTMLEELPPPPAREDVRDADPVDAGPVEAKEAAAPEEAEPPTRSTIEIPPIVPVEGYFDEQGEAAQGEPEVVKIDLGHADAGSVYDRVPMDAETPPAPAPEPEDGPEPEIEIEGDPAAEWEQAREQENDGEEVLDLADDQPCTDFTEYADAPFDEPAEAAPAPFVDPAQSQLRARLIGSAERNAGQGEEQPSLLALLWRWLTGRS